MVPHESTSKKQALYKHMGKLLHCLNVMGLEQLAVVEEGGHGVVLHAALQAHNKGVTVMSVHLIAPNMARSHQA